MRTLRFIVLDILGLALIVQGAVRFEGPVIMASLIYVLLPPVALSGNAAAVCVLLPFAVLAYYLRKLYRIKKEEN